MESFNVVVTVSTTVCIDAENPDDAIEKVSQALNNGDATLLQLYPRKSCRREKLC